MNMTRTQRYDCGGQAHHRCRGHVADLRPSMTFRPWPGAGRYERVPCRGCGYGSAPPLASDGASCAARSCREGN